MLLNKIISERIATIIALIMAVIIYGILIMLLKIFEREEILFLPYGKKLYEYLSKIGIYKNGKTLDT